MTALALIAITAFLLAWPLTEASYAIGRALDNRIARMVAAWEQREANADRLADYLAHTDDALDLCKPQRIDLYGDRFETTAREIAALPEIQEHR